MFEPAGTIRRDLATLDVRAVFALVYTAIGLTAITYLKDPKYLETVLEQVGASTAVDLYSHSNLYGLLWWCFISISFYFIVPAFVVVFIQKRRLSEIGLALRIEPGFRRLLAACLAVMLPLVYLMSLTASFAAKYPFLQLYDGSSYLSGTLLIWELAYFLQFFGLEFFFRGFLLNSLKPAIGLYSIFVMTVPYTMIHFQKPMAETFAAIVAGLFLGWLSYKNGSIWLGFVLHCTVAFSMDVMALYNKGLLF
jgi:membrane protease YdiL (CAAX protease family)